MKGFRRDKTYQLRQLLSTTVNEEIGTQRVYGHLQIQQNVDHPKRQISEPTFSSFYVQTTKNQRLLHAIKYCVISIKYCILYVLLLHCNGNIILEKPLDFMHCVASRFGYPNFRLSEISLVPINSDNRHYIYIISTSIAYSAIDH